MSDDSSQTNCSYSSFQQMLWRRSVGPWLSQFDAASNTSRVHNTGIERRGYQRTAQGLWLKEKRKKQKSTAQTNSCISKQKYDPSKDEKITGNPSKTVFIARLDYLTTEETLTDIFCKHGGISQLRLVTNARTGKSKGYAFVEFEEERDAKKVPTAFKQDGLRIDGREVLVDRVRAGVIPSWLPRRLGGGLGQRQKGTQQFPRKPYFGGSVHMDHKHQLTKRKM